MQGYIKDYRQELDSDIWAMPPLYHRIWQYLKYMANHKDNSIPMRDGSKILIKEGQHLTSIRQIAKNVAWYERGIEKIPNPKTVKEVLSWLESSNMILTDKSNRKYTLITIVNYGFYQGNDTDKVTESNTLKVTVSKQTTDINKNDKKDTTTTTTEKEPNAFTFYEQEIGILSPLVIGQLSSWLEDYEEQQEIIILAIQIAVERNKRSMGYITSILKSWFDKGARTLNACEALQAEFKRGKVTAAGSQNKKGVDWGELRE